MRSRCRWLTSSARFVVASIAASAPLIVGAPALAATQSGAFRLAMGHASRPAFYFVVASPGLVAVRVDTSMDEPVSVTLYAGTTVVQSAQGQRHVEIRVDATREHIAGGSEWAVVVTGSRPSTTGDGRITVDAPDARTMSPTHPLDAWLRIHPAVAFHLTWNDAGRSVSYSAWPATMRAGLWDAFDAARSGRPSDLPDPLPNAWTRQPGEDAGTIHTAFAPDVARAFYLSTVAHSLAVEMDRRVPWSVDDFNSDELDALFASTSLFWWNEEQRAYEISEFDHGWAVPAPPQTAWSFLQREGLLRSTRQDTVTVLVGWARTLTHFAGPVSRENFRDHWGYDGDMPVSRALTGTRYAGTMFGSAPGYDQVRHYTAGCQGTAGLLVSVLRAANIPVRPRMVSNAASTHATVLFLSEDRALSHADDPYSALVEGSDPSELLIDLETYQRWLGPLSKDAGRYIGRQAMAVGVARLPPVVRRTHDRDRQQGLAPEQSGVFSMFRASFSMQELQDARLWERLDEARLAQAGGMAAHASDDSWIEAETITPTLTGGAASVQSLDQALLGTWRNQQQLRWRDARPGAELSLPFEVTEAGTYRISVRFTRAPNYAIVVVRLDDQPEALDRVSLYAPQMVAADPLVMGEHVLTPGPHRLRFSIIGAHAQAVPDYMVGIDAVRLERLR